MKKLSLRGTWIPERGMVQVTVLERHHTDEEFGNDDMDGLFMGKTCCFIPSGFSNQWSGAMTTPSINTDDGLLDVSIGARGSYLYCTNEHWQLIKRGVEEYNKWGETQ